MPRDSEFAVQLRALREHAGRPAQAGIALAVGLTHGSIGYYLRGVYTPPWDTAAKVIQVLGGNPEDFREAWRASRYATLPSAQLTSIPGLRELLVRQERLADDVREFLAGATPDALFLSLPRGKIAEYRLRGEGSSVAVRHAVPGCRESGTAGDLGQAFEWALQHEQGGHSGES